MRIKLKEKVDMDESTTIFMIFIFATIFITIINIFWGVEVSIHFLTWKPVTWYLLRSTILTTIINLIYLAIFFKKTRNKYEI